MPEEKLERLIFERMKRLALRLSGGDVPDLGVDQEMGGSCRGDRLGKFAGSFGDQQLSFQRYHEVLAVSVDEIIRPATMR